MSNEHRRDTEPLDYVRNVFHEIADAMPIENGSPLGTAMAAQRQRVRGKTLRGKIR